MCNIIKNRRSKEPFFGNETKKEYEEGKKEMKTRVFSSCFSLSLSRPLFSLFLFSLSCLTEKSRKENARMLLNAKKYASETYTLKTKTLSTAGRSDRPSSK